MQYQRKVIQEVPMVESQAANQIKKKVNLPAAVFNRRENENNSILSNRPPTPTRKQGLLSPSKSRPEKSLKASNCPVRSNKGLACTNHENKPAQFLVETEDQQFPYCQKCSILLASQGFKLIKLEDDFNPLDVMENQERRTEIERFLSKLNETQQYMTSYKQQITNKMTQSHQNLSQNIHQISQYYQYLIDSIQRHKAETIQLLTQHVEGNQVEVKGAIQTLNECLQGAAEMRQDIIGSIEIIKDARQDKFRPVMDAYYERISNFHQCLEEIKDCSIPPTSLVFNEIEEISKQTTDMIQIAFDENNENYGTNRASSNPYFSFQEEPAEQFKGKGSKIFPQKQAETGYESGLRNSNISRHKVGDSMAQLE